VRLALKAVMQNDGDFVDVVMVAHAGAPGEDIVQTGTIRCHGRDGAVVPAAD
jgi:hypothetical protein